MGDVYVGIDVSKARLDLAWTGGRDEQVANDEASVAKLVERMRGEKPTLVVMEASGGYERLVLDALQEGGIAAVAVNPRQVRDFAKALGRLAKTDRLDARVLCEYAERVRPTVRAPRSRLSRELADLVARRRQLVEMIAAEKTRAKQLPRGESTVRTSVAAVVALLREQLKVVDRALDVEAARDTSATKAIALMTSVPGVGRVTAVTLCAALPELGDASRKEVAALAGVAPLARDSGLLRGSRSCWGGRANVRAVLYMATVVAVRCNPVLKATYQALRARGKQPKVAIIACVRKLLTMLNAMLRSGVAWSPKLVEAPDAAGVPIPLPS